jgi:hypothetical protein
VPKVCTHARKGETQEGKGTDLLVLVVLNGERIVDPGRFFFVREASTFFLLPRSLA